MIRVVEVLSDGEFHTHDLEVTPAQPGHFTLRIGEMVAGDVIEGGCATITMSSEDLRRHIAEATALLEQMGAA